ncbi:hypothetical protein G9A89_020527 [Geosiphon pyriformis]|nr:hypothetical protein G9A89_020527 [Geosiphon pyriformis]
MIQAVAAWSTRRLSWSISCFMIMLPADPLFRINLMSIPPTLVFKLSMSKGNMVARMVSSVIVAGGILLFVCLEGWEIHSISLPFTVGVSQDWAGPQAIGRDSPLLVWMGCKRKFDSEGLLVSLVVVDNNSGTVVECTELVVRIGAVDSEVSGSSNSCGDWIFKVVAVADDFVAVGICCFSFSLNWVIFTSMSEVPLMAKLMA